MIEKELQSIGLTIGESKAYISLLEIGSSTVGPIAKKSGISYSKIYEVLSRLIEKGIVSFVIKNKSKYFQAVKPELLHTFLDRQEKEIEQNKKKLKEILPKIKTHSKSGEETQSAEIFYGLNGILIASKKLYSEVKKNDVALFFYVHKKEYSEVVDDFYLKLAPFYKEKKIKFKGVGSKEWANSDYAKKTASFIDARYVEFPLPGTIDIYEDKVLQVTWGESPIGIFVQSKQIAEDYRNYFNEVWKIAKKGGRT